MKSIFVADLKDGQPVQGLFLVRSREVRSSPRTQSTWLQLVVVDRTGSIEAKLWKSAGQESGFEESARVAEPQQVIRVHGRAKTYQGRLELTIERLLPAAESEFDRADFVAHTRENVDELFAALLAEVRKMHNPWLQKLLLSFLEDPEIAKKMRRAPAAMTMHHAYVGGLLEHISSLSGLARAACAHYAGVDADLLLSGVVLHDIGKTEELTDTAAITYSTEGRLLGHITIGVAMTQRKISDIGGFPPRLAMLVEHMILSHHGSLEFGAPVLPCFREAVLLHYLDDMDSKMASIRASLEAPAVDAAWTPRNPALGRGLLRADDFLRDAVAPAPETPASTSASASSSQSKRGR